MNEVSLKIKGILTGHGGKSNHFAKALSKALVHIAPHLKLDDNKKYEFSCIIEKNSSFPDVFHSFSNIDLHAVKNEEEVREDRYYGNGSDFIKNLPIMKGDDERWYVIDNPYHGKLWCSSCGKYKDKENE